MKVLAGVITSSPGPISNARSASSIADSPVPTPMRVARADVGGVLGLEPLDRGAQDEIAASTISSRNAPSIAAAQRRVLRLKIDKRYLHRRHHFPQPKTEVDDRPEDAPPVDARPHFRVAQRVRRIDFRHRDLHVAVAEPDRFQHQVRLQLVAIEPLLPPVDPRIAQDRGAEGAEAVGALGDALARRERERPADGSPGSRGRGTPACCRSRRRPDSASPGRNRRCRARSGASSAGISSGSSLSLPAWITSTS